MPFGRQEAKTFSGAVPPEPPKGLCHGLAGGLTTPKLTHTPSCFFAMLVFHAHIS